MGGVGKEQKKQEGWQSPGQQAVPGVPASGEGNAAKKDELHAQVSGTETPVLDAAAADIGSTVPSDDLIPDSVKKAGGMAASAAEKVARFVALSPMLTTGAQTAAGAVVGVGVILAMLQYYWQATKAGNSNERRAKLRAKCYAVTSFLYDGGARTGVSSVFDTAPGSEYVSCEKAWNEGWVEAIPYAASWFNDLYGGVANEMEAAGEDRPSKQQVKDALKTKLPANAADFCLDLMNEEKVLAELDGAVDRMYWDTNTKVVKYPK